jgi:glycosyltransferase involved in cell wall biosynthesis
MKIVFFAHPLFLGSQSMPRFVDMLAKGMEEKGHEIVVLRPEPLFSKLPAKGIKKWLGYIDQYIVFPRYAKRIIKSKGNDVLFVITDHALGPYVPLIDQRHHVIHCHDFLAQRSAMGEITVNPTSATGRFYQSYIRNGYLKGKNFISVSRKTKEDLDRFLVKTPVTSDVIYNGLNSSFIPGDINQVRETLTVSFNIDLTDGYILHVGGNQWYKNRLGVIEIYNCWREQGKINIPLLLIGNAPTADLRIAFENSHYKNDIHFLSGIDDHNVRMAYQGASVFLFPSLAEGFGWPIAEAMASGTLVITTDEAPMTEVAGDAAFLIPARPSSPDLINEWKEICAAKLNEVINLNDQEKDIAVQTGISNAKRFNSAATLNSIEARYQSILQQNL